PCSFCSRKEKKVDNMKPKHPDEQEIPFRLRELMKSREAMKRWEVELTRAVVLRSPRCSWRHPPAPSDVPSLPCQRQGTPMLSLLQFQNKKLEKARKKREEKKEAMLEKSLFQDTVPFGEVVTQPPTITSRPRGQGPVQRAGRKQLLLTSHLGQGQSPASLAAPVSMARRRILEEERARVIQAYRDIQRRKQQQREAAGGSAQAGRR
ncbi:Coiled-coil domain-containing protein 137, partial [Colius striatus]